MIGMGLWHTRALMVGGVVGLTAFVALLSPHGAAGAPGRQAITATVNAVTINPTILELPSWALAAGASTVDTEMLTGSTCVPTTSYGITDEFLLIHQEWCEGLNAVTGVYQDFRLDPTDPTPFIGERAASVYPTSAAAQAVVQGINSHLSSENDLDGTCNAAPNCILASFQDVETIENPDGTTSPGTTHDVEYAVWSSGNIVSEVAISIDPSLSGAVGRSYRDSMINNGAILVGEILAGQQPAQPTAAPTLTSTPSPTPTLLPTVTPIPSATATSIPFAFSVRTVKVAYGSANPQKAMSHASLTRVHIGQTVKLLIYATFVGINASMPIRLGFRVIRAGSTSYFKSEGDTLTSTDNGGVTVYWLTFRPTTSGTYAFSGTVFAGSKHQHKSVTFSVA